MCDFGALRFKMGFCQWAEMGPKVGQKRVVGCQSGVLMRQSPLFSPTLNPVRHIHENPLFTQLKGGGNSFPERALKQSQPSINVGAAPGFVLQKDSGIFDS